MTRQQAIRAGKVRMGIQEIRDYLLVYGCTTAKLEASMLKRHAILVRRA
jgi:hypothetical protein